MADTSFFDKKMALPVSRREALRGGLVASAAAAVAGIAGHQVAAATVPTPVKEAAAANLPGPQPPFAVPKIAREEWARKIAELDQSGKWSPRPLLGDPLAAAPSAPYDVTIASEITPSVDLASLSGKVDKINENLERITSLLDRMLSPKATTASDPLLQPQVSALMKLIVDEHGHVLSLRDRRGRDIGNVTAVEYWQDPVERYDSIFPHANDPCLKTVAKANIEIRLIAQLLSFNQQSFDAAKHTFLRPCFNGRLGAQTHDGEAIVTAEMTRSGRSASAYDQATSSQLIAQVEIIVERKQPTGDEAASMRQAWVREFGDPNDPKVAAEIEKCVQELHGTGPNRNGDIFKTGRQMGKSQAIRHEQELQRQREIAMLQLSMGGQISRTTALNTLGLDYADEQKRLHEEMRRQAETELQAAMSEVSFTTGTPSNA